MHKVSIGPSDIEIYSVDHLLYRNLEIYGLSQYQVHLAKVKAINRAGNATRLHP